MSDNNATITFRILQYCYHGTVTTTVTGSQLYNCNSLVSTIVTYTKKLAVTNTDWSVELVLSTL